MQHHVISDRPLHCGYEPKQLRRASAGVPDAREPTVRRARGAGASLGKEPGSLVRAALQLHAAPGAPAVARLPGSSRALRRHPVSASPLHQHLRHPWLFRDATTGDRLLANRRDVFLPELGNIGENGRPQYVPIKITLPVYTLVERCLQVTRQLVPKEDFEQLPIPRSLQQELARVPDLQRELAELRRSSAQEDGAEH
ncbi:von Hippel-Lindau disease tumor suppressor-like isoform X1 [Lampetra fluviatilis]